MVYYLLDISLHRYQSMQLSLKTDNQVQYKCITSELTAHTLTKQPHGALNSEKQSCFWVET